MRMVLLGTALSALCLGCSPSIAASAETDAFVANVRLNAFFLDRSSSLANDRSENTDLSAFAGREANAQKVVIETIDRHTTPEVAQTAPVTVASNDLVTGRSVAVDGASLDETLAAPPGSGALMPAAMITLDRLSASKGKAFDTLYKATQVNALRQLAGFYNAYGMTGDDPALKQTAKSQLAVTNGLIEDLARF